MWIGWYCQLQKDLWTLLATRSVKCAFINLHEKNWRHGCGPSACDHKLVASLHPLRRNAATALSNGPEATGHKMVLLGAIKKYNPSLLSYLSSIPCLDDCEMREVLLQLGIHSYGIKESKRCFFARRKYGWGQNCAWSKYCKILLNITDMEKKSTTHTSVQGICNILHLSSIFFEQFGSIWYITSIFLSSLCRTVG